MVTASLSGPSSLGCSGGRSAPPSPNGFRASGKGDCRDHDFGGRQDAGEADPIRLPRRRRWAVVPPVSARSRSPSRCGNRIQESHRCTRQSDPVPASRFPRAVIQGDGNEEATDTQTLRRHHHQPFPADSGLGAGAVRARRVEASRVSASSFAKNTSRTLALGAASSLGCSEGSCNSGASLGDSRSAGSDPLDGPQGCGTPRGATSATPG